MKKMTLTGQIFLSLVLAVTLGAMLTDKTEIAKNYILPLGAIYLRLLKWVLGPLVFFSIMGSVISLKDIRKVGIIGGKTIVYYFMTTALAIMIGLGIAVLLKGIFPVLETGSLSFQATSSVHFMDTVVNIFPANFITPFSEANMLQVIVSSLIIGFALISMDARADKAREAIRFLNEIFSKVMEMILKASPFGVFCLLCPVIAENGPAVVGVLAKVLLVAYVCYIVHMVFVYTATVGGIAKRNPIAFFRAMMPAIIFSFSSASSVGTIPLNLECVGKLGVRKEVSSFIIPLGATVNMDGTAIYQGVCAVFIASCYGIDLSIGQMITIILTATLASIGTAGVPGAGVVMLAMVLESVGLPVAGIALVAGIDRLFDMGRTTVNITGDACCALVIDALEKRKEKKKLASNA